MPALLVAWHEVPAVRPEVCLMDRALSKGNPASHPLHFG
jgi:hypothetical protein